jgi:hypothetical protein
MSLQLPLKVERYAGLLVHVKLKLNGAPLRCAGWRAVMAIRDHPGAPVRIQLASDAVTANGSRITWTDADDGELDIDLKPDDSADETRFPRVNIRPFTRGYAGDLLLFAGASLSVRKAIPLPLEFDETVTPS